MLDKSFSNSFLVEHLSKAYVSAQLCLTGSALTNAIPNRHSALRWELLRFVHSLFRALYSDPCCFYSTPLTWKSLLEVSAVVHQWQQMMLGMMESGKADCGLTLRRLTFCGVQTANRISTSSGNSTLSI